MRRLLLLCLATCAACGEKEKPQKNLAQLVDELEEEQCATLAQSIVVLVKIASDRDREEFSGGDLNMAAIYPLTGSKPDLTALRGAAQALAGMEGGDRERTVAALRHADHEVRRIGIVAALRQRPDGAMIEPLVGCLGHAREDISALAANVLRKFESAAIPRLKAALKQPSLRGRWWTARALLMFSREVEAAVFAPLLDDDIDIAVLAAARHAMEGLAPEKTLPIFKRGLLSSDPYIARMAVASAGSYGAKGASLAPELVLRLAAKDLDMRHAASIGLLGLGEAALPQLTTGLSSDSPHTRLYCAKVLGEIGASTDGAIDGLIALLQDGDRSLEELPDSDDISTVANFVADKRAHDEYRGVRAMAALSLARIGPKAARAVPDLIGALADEHDPVRLYAAGALGRMKVDSADVRKALSLASNDKVDSVRRAAAKALLALESENR